MKYKQYQKMKDSGVEWIGEIPEEWEVRKLKFCLKDDGFKSGPFGSKLITANLDDSGRILVYTPEHLVNENVQFSQYIPMEREKELESYLVQVDDILIPIVGTLGTAKLLTAKDPPGILNQRLCRISLDNNILLLKYGLFLITQTELAKIQIELNKKGAILDHITRDIILNSFFPHPSISEQEEIYDFLQKETAQFDELIAKSKQQITLLQEKRQATITQAVTKGLDPSVSMKDSKILGIKNIPETWNEVNLGLISKLFVPMRDKPKKFDGKIPWLRIEDIKGKYAHDTLSNQYVSENTIKEMNLKVYPVGTVLCSCSATIGFYAITKKELVTNQTFIGIYPDKKLHNEFLYYFLNSQTENIRRLGVGATIPYITREKFQKLKIILPPIEQQIQISEFLDKQTAQFDELIAKSKQQITLLEEKIQALITAAVTGKIDVRK